MPTATPLEILVVEVDEGLQSLIASLLDDEGYQARVVSNGRAALEALEHERPALILLDMDNLEGQSEKLVRDVRARYGRQVPLVIIGPRYEAATMAQAAGADASLGKPFDIDALLSVVSRLTKGDAS